MKPMTVPKFLAAKTKGRKLSMVTAYDFQWATIFDEAGVDSILVGDTLGMVVQGHSTTLPVTLEQMIYHGEIVSRAAKRAMVIVDMPFMSYQVSPEQAITNAGRILKETTATAVKLEGGENQAKTIAALTNADIPVVAHVGLKPQSVNLIGSLGKIQRDEKQLMADAHAAQNAGAFSIVLEMIPQTIAKKITEELDIPTIGIGAGQHCDGQVLVSNDMFNLTPDFNPKFLKKYANLRDIGLAATRQYVEEVQAGTFPGKEHCHD
ncbi:3-methyl-2-oxobutanoate hydroxymethyltransferase [hydrothermal vent metagenome]|uniref:3-methyl-2-oxobutanoate hydroxymethyltransferase n=1 Tax=hydrothermal vent metagenome TaxID=652676 RepID=A0A3B1DQQ2_9ZZZZ